MLLINFKNKKTSIIQKAHLGAEIANVTFLLTKKTRNVQIRKTPIKSNIVFNLKEDFLILKIISIY
jgi:hypothetical protein